MNLTQATLVAVCGLQGLGCLAALLLVLHRVAKPSEEMVKDLAWNYAQMFLHGWRQGGGGANAAAEPMPWRPTERGEPAKRYGPTSAHDAAPPDYDDEEMIVGLNPPMPADEAR